LKDKEILVSKIVVVGASPALQQILVLSSFTPHSVNRAAKHYSSFAGKGVNAARVAARLGGNVQLVTVMDSSSLERFQRDAQTWGVGIEAVETIAAVRTCTTLLGHESVHGTELVQEAPSLTSEESAHFQELAFQVIAELSPSDVLVLTGSIPRGVPTTLYRDLARATQAITIVDAHGAPLRAVLDAIDRVSWIKPNLTEWFELSRDLGGNDPFSSAQSLSPSSRFLLTDGPRPAVLLGLHGRRWRIPVAKIAVVNPIGSGDAVTGGLAYAMAYRLSDPDAIRLALACGMSDCETIEPGLVDPERVQEISQKLSIETLA
jgi:tagatose 6-phosphate kinase